MKIDFTKLSAPFAPDKVSWRVGATSKDKSKGLALAYLDARDVMERLDEVCGPGLWQTRYPHVGNKTCCEIGIYSAELEAMIWKSNGAGDTDVEGEKGAFSDAFKRAAVLWGIGRYLYDLGNVWVELQSRGKSFVIKDQEKPKLAKVLQNLQSGKAAEGSPFTKPEPTEDEINTRYSDILTAIDNAETVDELDRISKDQATPLWPHLAGPERKTINDNGAARKAKLTQKEAA